MLELNDFIWAVKYHTPDRIKVMLYTAPGLAGALVRALRGRKILARKLSAGVVVVYAAESVVKVLLGVTPQAHREPLSSALDRYEQAWAPLAKFRRASQEERRECCRAAQAVCEAVRVEYKG